MLTQDKLSKRKKHDQHAQERDFQVGQSVMVSNMGAGPCFIPGTIIQKQGPVTYLIGVSAGKHGSNIVIRLRALQIKKGK